METNQQQTNREKQMITRTQCIKELCEKSRSKRSMGIGLGSLSLVFSIIIAFAVYINHLSLLYLLFLFGLIALTVFLYIFAIINNNTIRKIKGLDFHITIERCTGKYHQDDFKRFKLYGDYLVFPGEQEYRIDYSYKGNYDDLLHQETEYSQAYTGKKFYTFRINDEKILFALPADSFCFSPDEFEDCGDRFFPKKTVDETVSDGAPRTYNFDEDIRQQSSEQYQSYSSDNKTAIDAVYAANKKAKIMRIVTGIISGVNLFPGLIIIIIMRSFSGSNCHQYLLSNGSVCFYDSLLLQDSIKSKTRFARDRQGLRRLL